MALCAPVSLLAQTASVTAAQSVSTKTSTADWQIATDKGEYDEAVKLALAIPAGHSNASELAQLIQSATARKLSQSAQWRAFLHYKPTLGNGWRSQVDSPQFFMSSKGKVDPQAELNATLAALFSVNAKPPLRLTAFCRFVARRYWLVEQLGSQADLLPDGDCPEFDRYVDYLQADSLTLIFPSAHPNSPSSALGHTLLRIDKKEQRAESRLLNMSINFAAEVPEEVSGAAYAIKGLSGGFQGKFRMLPYHMKLREYGQIENRDTWEYPLRLSKAQVDLVLRHAYEMLISHFDYFFFSENCSYHLLSLLEVANPEHSLTDNFGLWTIPVDTIRLLEEQYLVEEKRFVPSSIRQLRARRDTMTDDDGRLVLKALDQGLDTVESELAAREP